MCVCASRQDERRLDRKRGENPPQEKKEKNKPPPPKSNNLIGT